VEAFDADAIAAGKLDRGELTLEIAPAKIVSICGFLKYDQKFVRLSSVTAVDRYPPSRASKWSTICIPSSRNSACA
jgi:NADH-quinone oxidoreductase subunit C